MRGRVYLLWLKLELYNPVGSVEFRTAIGLVMAFAAQTPIRPGTRVVESTSGNIGLLWHTYSPRSAAISWRQSTLKLPDMRQALQSEGACLVMVSATDINHSYLAQRLREASELVCQEPALRWTDQHRSPANPAIQREITATEILRQTDGAVDMVLAVVSTEGTLAGLSADLGASRPGIHICAMDAHGSLVTSHAGAAHLLIGIGAARKSEVLGADTYDRNFGVFFELDSR